MENMLLQIGLIVVAYLVGSIPNGLWIGKVFLGIDLRQLGSKNLGTSNAIRVMGIKYGLLTFVLDAFKGALPIILVYILRATNDFQTNLTLFNQTYDYAILFGVVAVIGHTFPIFNKFKGGKAVATSAGIVLSLTPIAGIACILVYIAVVAITKYASLGSTFAALTVFIVSLFEFMIPDGKLIDNLFVIIVYGLMILFIFYRHIENYKRLIKGTENKMTFKRK
ncbi:MAG: glycerol-3-phosphate 1-O-acyltransferase PlsY [Acholeplasma sp.]|nr:glycerol-3-phosphate 1-O-acyltransferase PlsY [Acholeplasma sp.]